MHAHGNEKHFHRIQFDFSEKVMAELRTLQHRLKVSRGAVLMRALKVLVWAEAQHHHGNKIFVKRQNGEMLEIRFPFLEPEQGRTPADPEKHQA